jgi:hypothetical protein
LADVSRLDMILILLSCNAGLEKELGELKDATQYVIDLYVPQEEGAEPKPLIDQLDEAEGRIKGLLLDTANLAAAATLLTVKYHDPSLDPQKVLLTRNVHLAPSTQQAEQAGFTRAKNHKTCQSIFPEN